MVFELINGLYMRPLEPGFTTSVEEEGTVLGGGMYMIVVLELR